MDKLAIRYVIDGNEKFVDANTGKTITNTDGYQVMDNYTEGLPSGSGFSNNPYDTNEAIDAAMETDKPIYRSSGNGDMTSYMVGADNPDASNNFMYQHQPGFLKAASVLPGPIGMVAKGARGVLGIQNDIATNRARQYLGLKEDGPLNRLGFMKDGQGYVGDVKFKDNPNVYSVGLDAVNKNNQTSMTPDEARMRGLLAGGLTEATRDEKKQNLKDFKTDKKAILDKADLGPLELNQVTENLKTGTPVPQARPSELASAEKISPSMLAYHGLGLQDFAPSTDPDLPTRDMANVNYDLAGKGRSEIPSSGIGNKVSDVVTDMLGPGYSVNVTSGQEPAGARAVGTAHRHPEGWAADLTITDPSGRKLDVSNPDDAKAIHDVAEGMAARYGANFGMGKEYMGTNTMHIDTMPLDAEHPGGAQWASLGKEWAGDLDQARQTGVMPSQYYDVNNPPTPEDRPKSLDVGQSGFAREPAPASTSMAQNTLNPNRWSNITDEDKSLMAQTLAGEIDLSKTDLSTEQGRQEAYGILSTMENRADKFGGISKAITAPNQYSTWNNDAASNTAMKNYDTRKDVYDSLVADYMGDPNSNLGFTSYYNSSLVNPGWSSSMSNPTNIGPHTFGFLSEYQSNDTKTAAQSLVQPKTIFNSSAQVPQSGLLGQDHLSSFMSNNSTKQSSNQPATQSSNSTSPSANVSGTGMSNTNNTKTSSGTSSGWGQRSDSPTQSAGAASRSDGWS